MPSRQRQLDLPETIEVFLLAIVKLGACPCGFKIPASDE